MRAVVQRVSSAHVEVAGEVVSSIGKGFVCLVGIGEQDTTEDAEWLIRKILRCRAWSHPETDTGWAADVRTIGGELLLVSQFTLHARLTKAKPSYSRAMPPQEARAFWDAFVARARADYQASLVKEGVFGAMMQVALTNDGPVTFWLDSAARD